MLERLRIQEVSEIILSVPEGVVIAGTDLSVGEPVMIIEKPALSQLTFNTREKKVESRGFISASGTTRNIDFTINEGSVLYSVWSYLHGINTIKTTSLLRGTEWIHADNEQYVKLSAPSAPIKPVLYKKNDEDKLSLLTYQKDYTIVYQGEDNKEYLIQFNEPVSGDYFICYTYEIKDVDTTNVKQIHNNIFCSMDIYFDAVDMDTDDKHVVCIHCDKVQVSTDLAIGINNSQKASFTPITIRSVPDGNELNKDIAVITVI